MKKTVRIIAVLMMVAMLSLALVSCAKTLSGSYEGENWLGQKVTYTFEKNTFVKKTTTEVFGSEVVTTEEGTYEIKEDPENSEKLVISFTTVNGDKTVTNTYSFSEGVMDGKKVIVINDTNYAKVK